MKIELIDIDDNLITPENVVQLVYLEEIDAPCNSLSFTFKSDGSLSEVVGVKAYVGDKLVFNGYCDNQKMTADKNGYKNYIYARSSACLLVDTQSQPFTYNCPTVKQLFANNARDFGFENNIEEISNSEKYEVSLGTSCFGAINNFVSLLSGQTVYVTPNNKLKLREYSENIKSFDEYDVLSAVSIINRSEPFYQINFKKQQSSEYKLHCKSKLSEDKQLAKQGYVNLINLPQWQRENTILNKLKSSFDDYKLLEITVLGYADEKLLQRFCYDGKVGTFDDCVLVKKKYSFDENGEKTRLTLRKEMDVQEVTYVD